MQVGGGENFTVTRKTKQPACNVPNEIVLLDGISWIERDCKKRKANIAKSYKV